MKSTTKTSTTGRIVVRIRRRATVDAVVVDAVVVDIVVVVPGRGIDEAQHQVTHDTVDVRHRGEAEGGWGHASMSTFFDVVSAAEYRTAAAAGAMLNRPHPTSIVMRFTFSSKSMKRNVEKPSKTEGNSKKVETLASKYCIFNIFNFHA